MPSFNGEKLRVNLRLSINRLKLLEKKKTEQALKARKEIADYIKAGRLERARIRVEHIIREDYMVEAMEVVELYCDLLIARFGMLQTMKFCEESILESVSTLIWVAPRLCADIPELMVVSKQLENKFKKEFVQQAQSNLSGTVNSKVIHRLGVEAPKKSLVENYMVEIARNYKVEFEPDSSLLMGEDDLPPLGDEKPFFPDGMGGGGGGMEPQTNPYAPEPINPYPTHQTGAGPLPHKMPPQDFMPPPPHLLPPGNLPPPGLAPPYSEHPPMNNALPYPGDHALPGQQMPVLPQVPNSTPMAPSDGLDLPPVPTTGFPDSSVSSSTGGDVDFDDLTKRFEDLKKRR